MGRSSHARTAPRRRTIESSFVLIRPVRSSREASTIACWSIQAAISKRIATFPRRGDEPVEGLLDAPTAAAFPGHSRIAAVMVVAEATDFTRPAEIAYEIREKPHAKSVAEHRGFEFPVRYFNVVFIFFKRF